MADNSISCGEVQQMFKGQRILILGDPISRSIYKDLLCLLTGHNRQLTNEELKFNRCNHQKNILFGEIIDLFKIDRSQSINNIERRKFISNDLSCSLYYCFISRIWNKTVETLLQIIQQFDLVFIQSTIWDLTKYSDTNEQFLLQNLDTCLKRFTHLNKNIVWVFLPLPISHDLLGLNNLILNLRTSVLDIIQCYNCKYLDLYEALKNYSNIHNYDSLHLNPNGHRLISFFLVKFINNIRQQVLINLNGASSSNNLIVQVCDTSNDIVPSSDNCIAEVSNTSADVVPSSKSNKV